jgi:hypothetical protein
VDSLVVVRAVGRLVDIDFLDVASLVPGPAGGRIIELHGSLEVFFVVIETTDRPLLDWPAGLVIGLFTHRTLRWSARAPGFRSGRGHTARVTGDERTRRATGTRTAEATARGRTTKAARRPGCAAAITAAATTTAVATTRATRAWATVTTGARPGRTIFTGARFADGEGAPVERLAVVSVDYLLGMVALGEVHEGEAPRTSGLTIGRQHHLCGLGDLGKQGTQVGLGGAVGQVSNE